MDETMESNKLGWYWGREAETWNGIHLVPFPEEEANEGRLQSMPGEGAELDTPTNYTGIQQK